MVSFPIFQKALLGAALALSCSSADARPHGPIAVTAAWIRPASAGVNGAGYLLIANRGRAADTLVAVGSPASRAGSIHQSAMAGGVMTMRQLPSLVIAPGASVAFSPGGFHLMLEGLKRSLARGETVPATLTFAKAGRVPVTFAVRDTAPTP